MSYLIDIYRGEVLAQRNLLTFATYKAMFPQLIAGPIVRYRQIAGKIEGRRVSLFRLQYGIVLFIVGMSQKVLIANAVAVPADDLFGTAAGNLTLLAAWLGVVCYTLQIYFDFAGYSNMAIGMGHMMGFGYPPNFNRPYVSQSITEFWRRWHISLSTWFRDYLYVPLGGNRRGRLRTYLNLFLVFLICGFWHGASWTFAIWGLWHGGFLIVERMGLAGILRRCWQPLRHAYVMIVVMLGWVFFRCDTFAHALGYLGAMFGLGGATAAALPIARYASPSVWTVIVAGAVFAVLRPPGVRSLAPRWRPDAARYAAGGALMQAGVSFACLVLLVLSALTLATGSFNPFIYFRF
jgi:alginate O-acetyltransferase complex protein AlgI